MYTIYIYVCVCVQRKYITWTLDPLDFRIHGKSFSMGIPCPRENALYCYCKLGTQTDWRPHIIPKGTTWRHPACFWIQAIQDSKMLKVAPIASHCQTPFPSWSQLKLRTLVAPAARLPVPQDPFGCHHHGSTIGGLLDVAGWSMIIRNQSWWMVPHNHRNRCGGNIATPSLHTRPRAMIWGVNEGALAESGSQDEEMRAISSCRINT